MSACNWTQQTRKVILYDIVYDVAEFRERMYYSYEMCSHPFHFTHVTNICKQAYNKTLKFSFCVQIELLFPVI